MIYLLLGGLLVFLIAVARGMSSEKKISSTIPPSTVSTDTITNIINYYSKHYSVPTALIKAIIMQESSFRVNAKNPSDPSYGLMGIMPIVAQDFGLVKDWHNPTDAEIESIYYPPNNIGAGTKLLHSLLSRNELPIAVEMYNVGERGYKEKGYRNSAYRISVLDKYAQYLSEEN